MSDFPKFCTSCGAPLERGQKFCTSCGSPVSSYREGSGPNANASSRNNPSMPLSTKGNTSPMPVIDASYSAGNTQSFRAVDDIARQYRQSQDGLSDAGNTPSSLLAKKPLIVVIVVLAVVVCALAGVLFGVISSNGNQDNSVDSSSAQSVASNDADATSSSGSNSEANKNDSVSSDQALYDTLSGYYSRLGSYDEKIASCAKTFNSNYLSKDMSARSPYAASATSLQEEIEKDYSALKNISIPTNSRYASSYSAMLTCYYDCTQRIGAIVESWNNSLQFSDPTSHEDEICEPLSRDKSGNNNKYYTEFKNTYPSAKPSSPTD